MEQARLKYEKAIKTYKKLLEKELLSQMDFTVENKELSNFKNLFDMDLFSKYEKVCGCTYEEDIEISDNCLVIQTVGVDSYPDCLITLIMKYANVSYVDYDSERNDYGRTTYININS